MVANRLGSIRCEKERKIPSRERTKGLSANQPGRETFGPLSLELPLKLTLRGVFFNTCHLLDYFSRGLTMRMLFICGER